MSRVTEAIYVGRDNINYLEFRVDGALVPLNPISKIIGDPVKIPTGDYIVTMD